MRTTKAFSNDTSTAPLDFYIDFVRECLKRQGVDDGSDEDSDDDDEDPFAHALGHSTVGSGVALGEVKSAEDVVSSKFKLAEETGAVVSVDTPFKPRVPEAADSNDGDGDEAWQVGTGTGIVNGNNP